jgi:hypothetical protein
LGRINTLISGLSDATGDIQKVPVLARIAQAISFAGLVVSLPSLVLATPQGMDWLAWFLNLMGFLVGYLPVFLQTPFTLCFALLTLGTNVWQFVAEAGFTGTSFAQDVLSLLPSLLAPLNLAGGETLELTTVLLTVIPILGNWGAAACAMIGTLQGWNTTAAPQPVSLFQRYMPFVSK